MEKRKILIFADGLITEKDIKQEGILEKFKKYEKYGAETILATDDSFLAAGGQKAGILKMETQGRDWVNYAPEALEAVKDAEVLLVHFSAVNKIMFDTSEKLKLIGVVRSGLENVDTDIAKSRGIKVSNAPGRVSEPVADFTIGMILAELRNITQLNIASSKKWVEPSELEERRRHPLLMKDAVVGLIGFGIIGQKVAKRLKGFGCKILAFDPYGNPEKATELGVELTTYEDMLKRSDIVSMHARLLEETKDLFGEKQIALMKPTAFFVNTARAGLVDEKALVKALQEKRIAGAALDVFREEPLQKDNPLLSLDNVTLTSHIAGSAGSLINMSFEIMMEELDRYFKGEKLRNTIV